MSVKRRWPYDAVSPDLSREPPLGVHAAPLVDTFEHEIHVAPRA